MRNGDTVTARPANTLKEPASIETNVEVGKDPVLFLLNALGVGGSERKSVAAVNELHRTGWDVRLAYLDARTALLRSVNRGVPVIYLKRKGKLSLSVIRALRAYVHREKISKIVCVNLYPLLYAQVAMALLPARQRPSVILMQNTTQVVGRKARMNMLLFRPLMRRAQKIVFGCRAQRELWIRRYRLEERKCVVIYNGIDEQKFAPGTAGVGPGVAELGIDLRENDFVIGAVGTLWPNKNHIELIMALERLKDTLPNARLVIAGKGSERERLQAVAKASCLSDRVTLVGEIEDVRPILEVMDVFVLPSVLETFSNAALEAMSMQKPVILSNTGGMPELVRDGIDGFLYQQGDIDHLTALIKRLALDPTTRHEIGKNARESIIERFSLTRMVDEYRQLLRQDDFSAV